MAELRKCKECGKLFEPKGREKYCSDDHYRPCPICGKPVLAKYLSDPARKCDSCKWIKSKPSSGFSMPAKSLFNFTPVKPMGGSENKVQPKPASDPVVSNVSESDELSDKIDNRAHSIIDQAEFCRKITGSTMVYIGTQLSKGFIKGHQYVLEVDHNNGGTYSIWGREDVTTGEKVKVLIPLTSQTSFYQYFGTLKKQYREG